MKPAEERNLEIPALLRRFHLQPSKGLGQNFLSDGPSLDKIIQAANLSLDDEVLEVGPGLGNLTRHLARQAKKVVAVELDRKLIPALQWVMEPYKNVQIIQGDILNINLDELMVSGRYMVVANIPYYITSLLIRHLLEAKHPPERIILTVQKEVAERICAEAGRSSLLALSVQVYGVPAIRAYIPASAFHPEPKVDSAVLEINLHSQPLIPANQMEDFFQMIKAGFSQKRKTLRNALAGGLHLSPVDAGLLLTRAGIDPQRRAETLEIKEWKELVNVSSMKDKD